MAHPLADEGDHDRVGFEVYAFSLTEWAFSLIVACFPALRALIKHMREGARLRASEGELLGDTQSPGSSPDLEKEFWVRDGCSPRSGQNKVVIVGGCPTRIGAQR